MFNDNYTTLYIRHIKAIASDVFTSVNNLNPNFMNKMFQLKDITYVLRDSNILCQLQFNKITYSKRTFSYYGTHIWNTLPNNIKRCTMLKAWEGPKCQ